MRTSENAYRRRTSDSSQLYPPGAVLGQQGAEPNLTYFCSFAWMPRSNSYGTSQVVRRDPTLDYPGDVGSPMPVLPLPPAPPPPWRRSEPSGSRQFVQWTGATWRPRSPAASTSVATTPARIADGGAPATRMYSQIRASVIRMRVAVGTAKARSAK